MEETVSHDIDQLSITASNLWSMIPPSLISAKAWLPIDISVESTNMLLKNLTLNDVMVALPIENSTLESYKLYGLICSSKADLSISLADAAILRHHLYPKKIVNSQLTVDLLNMRICAKTDSKSTTVMENYLSSLFGSNSDAELTSHLKTSIPIAFAHNLVARQLTISLDHLIQRAENETEQDHVYSFIPLPITELNNSTSQSKGTKVTKYDFTYVNKAGDLSRIKEGTAKSTDEFIKILRSFGGKNLITVVENPLGELRCKMDLEKQTLIKIDPDRSNFVFADESLTEEDLKEMSALSEEIDDAEDFVLRIQGVNDSTNSLESSENAQRTKEIRKIERRIRELAKQIATTRKEIIQKLSNTVLPTTLNDFDRSNQNLYSSKDYAQFSQFYRQNVLENALATPKSAMRATSARENVENSRKSLTTPRRKSKRLSSSTTNNILRDHNKSVRHNSFKTRTPSGKEASYLDIAESAQPIKRKCQH